MPRHVSNLTTGLCSLIQLESKVEKVNGMGGRCCEYSKKLKCYVKIFIGGQKCLRTTALQKLLKEKHISARLEQRRFNLLNFNCYFFTYLSTLKRLLFAFVIF